jgi:hypothetical protein
VLANRAGAAGRQAEQVLRRGEEGVRAPIAATTGRLFGGDAPLAGPYIGSGSRAAQGYKTPVSMFAGSSNRGLDSIFSPPAEILADCPFEQAIEIAKDGKRSLIVHLLAQGDFASMTWNRDIWRHEDVKGMIRDHFVLYQQNSSECVVRRSAAFDGGIAATGEGSMLIERYSLSGSVSNVLFLDSRTEECLERIEGAVSGPEEFLVVASRVLTDSGGVGARPLKRVRPEAAKASEDEQLQMALEASKREAKRAVTVVDAPVVLDHDELVEFLYDDEDEDEEDRSAYVRAAVASSSKVAEAAPPPSEARSWQADLPKADTFIPTSVPGQPSPGDAGVLQVRLGLPDGRRIVWALREDEPVGHLFLIVSHLLGLPHPLAARFEAIRKAKAGQYGGGVGVAQVREFLGEFDPVCAAKAPFSIVLLRPPRDVCMDAQRTISEAALGGAALSVKLASE